jgi:hypothetical protein
MMSDNNNPKRDVKVTELVANDGILKGKKTDVQNPELWEFPMNYPLSIIGHEGEHENLLNEVKLILIWRLWKLNRQKQDVFIRYVPICT